jgi:PAS domain S-box-containing protein
MSCPKCGAETAEGQNYCGGCGAQLKNACPGCGTINPPFFKYCGQCGCNLVDVGSLLLDRAGLILAADATALKIIGQKAGTVKGKPFSLFVKVDDLVVFYSHWNELMRSAKRQSVEVELVPKPGATRHAQLALVLLKTKKEGTPRVHLALSDVTDARLAMQDAQTMQDLVNLIFSWADAFHPSQEGRREQTIGSVLEKIGLFAGAQYGFISRIDAKDKCLETDFQWRLASQDEPPAPPASMPIALMARLFNKITRDGRWVVNDAEALSALERKVLREWHRCELGAIMCHVIQRRQTPIGIIGVAAARPTHWSDHAVALVRLAGRLMADTLPRARPGASVIQPHGDHPGHSGGSAAESPVETIDIAEIEIIDEPPEAHGPATAPATKPEGRVPPRMKFASDKQKGDDGRNPVFPGEDGKYLMTCPQCGFQDTVSGRLFEIMGSAVRVQCPCRHRFRIIRELRTNFRKRVRLEGYFAQERHNGNKLASGDVWGPMVVLNLSRTGLQFKCGNAGLLRAGDFLQVRFNLDNANQTLIKKTVVVRSVSADMVGCQFDGTDRYDAVLGFYFL